MQLLRGPKSRTWVRFGNKKNMAVAECLGMVKTWESASVSACLCSKHVAMTFSTMYAE